jgi:hypothetical protein
MDRAPQVMLLIALGAAQPAAACDYPDEGTMPLHRALTRVKLLPETEAWQRGRREAGELVQYRLFLEKEARFGNSCYWTVEAAANGKPWRRFYVSPDGKSVFSDGAPPRTAASPKAARQSRGSTAAKP